MGERRLTDHGRFSVLVIDMFHYMDEEEETTIHGFPTLELAIEHARRRTRDSLEKQRGGATSHHDPRTRWYMFGEDCLVIGGDYKGSAEIDDFIDNPATAEQRDWGASEALIQRSDTSSTS